VSRWFRSYGYATIVDDLAIGAYPLDDEDVRALEFIGIKRVLNLVEDEEYGPGSREMVTYAYAEAGIEEQRLRLTDFGHLPADALNEAITIVNGWLDEGLSTYIHCRAGWQRSAAVAAGVVAIRHGLDVDNAVRLIRTRKPSADPLPHQREDLRAWWSARQRYVGGAPTTTD
jgi:protein-tyrosine phosphatase